MKKISYIEIFFIILVALVGFVFVRVAFSIQFDGMSISEIKQGYHPKGDYWIRTPFYYSSETNSIQGSNESSGLPLVIHPIAVHYDGENTYVCVVREQKKLDGISGTHYRVTFERLYVDLGSYHEIDMNTRWVEVKGIGDDRGYVVRKYDDDHSSFDCD